jgi:hypothetical protein
MMMTRTQRRSRVVRRNTREFSLLWWWWCRAFFVSVRRARERKHKDDDDDDVFVLFVVVVVVVSYKVFWVRTKTTNTNGICVGMSDPKKKRGTQEDTRNIYIFQRGVWYSGVRRSARKGHEREHKIRRIKICIEEHNNIHARVVFLLRLMTARRSVLRGLVLRDERL